MSQRRAPNPEPCHQLAFTRGGFEFDLAMTDGNLPSGIDAAGNRVEGGTADAVGGRDAELAYSVAAAYSGDTYKIGLAYLDNGDPDRNAYGGSQWIAMGTAIFDAVTVKAYYAGYDDYLQKDASFGATVDYTLNEKLTLTGLVRRDEEVNEDLDSYGIGVSYDLGGGAAFMAGVVRTDTIGSGETVADAGVTLKF
ncbi:porin [Cereibacter sp. SYSU M97828]|nr:porin [Cereibacter flavus]